MAAKVSEQDIENAIQSTFSLMSSSPDHQTGENDVGADDQKQSEEEPATTDTIENGDPTTTNAETNNATLSPYQQRRERNLRHQEQSAFAVGCVNVTWKEDRAPSNSCCGNGGEIEDVGNDSKMCWSAYCCGCTQRVGNLVVLWSTPGTLPTSEGQDAAAAEEQQRPKLHWVMGPYWPVNLFVTFPLIFGVSGWTLRSILQENGATSFRPAASDQQRIAVLVIWSILTALLIFSLMMISCRNPGVLYRHSEPLEDDWRWNDQAMTYRPTSARFDRECQVVIEGFDHTCPWTGTAIGSRNMFWFRIFVIMIPVCIAFSVVAFTFL